MGNELLPAPRVCAVCLHAPCLCPDVIEAEEDQEESPEAELVAGLLRGDFDAALSVEVISW